jgi:phage terminase small subunit
MATNSKIPAPSIPLGESGMALWRRLQSVYRFNPLETFVLEQAAQQADLIASLEAIVARDGVTVTGSKGQPRIHPAVTAIASARRVLARLLKDVGIPLPEKQDADPAPSPRSPSARSAGASYAAKKRWGTA